MQDTYFKDIVTRKEATNKLIEGLIDRGYHAQHGPTIKDE
jgi:hypothetical protein